MTLEIPKVPQKEQSEKPIVQTPEVQKDSEIPLAPVLQKSHSRSYPPVDS